MSSTFNNDSPFKFALSGATGKMGRSIINAAKNNPWFNIILKLNSSNIKNKITDNNSVYGNLDLWIDFSSTSSCLKYLEICKKHKIPMIIGTTGFTKLEYRKIFDASKYTAILLSPNMSLGANICQCLLIYLSKLWSTNDIGNTKISIKEVHHKKKLDAPSGTALKMADLITAHLPKKIPVNFVSKRIGKVKGRHQVTFSNTEEEIVIKHKVKNRSVFAGGTLMAAKWLLAQRKTAGVYSMLDIFNFNI